VGRGESECPKFGGTETCTIIDFCDIYRFGDQQAYMRFKDSWLK
jgi:hypothetical protein